MHSTEQNGLDAYGLDVYVKSFLQLHPIVPARPFVSTGVRHIISLGAQADFMRACRDFSPVQDHSSDPQAVISTAYGDMNDTGANLRPV
jgi:hypothetical protein